MPKVYEQQTSWQPAATQKMQYDKIQDFISPALENVARESQNAMDMMQQIGDKQAASDLERAAKDAAFEIENWQDFSEPEKTQDKMVASAMQKYDAVIANMDYATRNRLNMYNPKAREIYELKAKEKAADVSYNYAYQTAVANEDADVGRMISEAAPEGPEAVKARVDQHLARAKSTMRPLDYNKYEKSVTANAQKGLVDWYVAYGDLDKAITTIKNDKYAGAINESVRVNYLKAIKKAQKDGESDTDVAGTNMVDTLVHMGQTPQYAYAVMSELTSAIEQGYEPNKQLIEKYGNLPLAGGKTYYQLANMDYTTAVGIIDKNAKATGKSIAFQSEARMAFVPLMTEWARITKKDGSETVLKDDADITSLKTMYGDFVQHGYDRMLLTTSNSDLTKTLDQIADVVNKEKTAQGLAFDMVGQNMSSVFNSPTLSQRFSVPSTPEQAAGWNDVKKQQEELNAQQVNKAASAYNAIHVLNKATRVLGIKIPESKPASKYDDMRDDLKDMVKKGQITQQQYNERVRYLYDVSEGKATIAYPCPIKDTPTRVWNQCMATYGFGSVDDSAEYSKELDRGMHETSAWLRDNSIRKYDAGTVGDIYQVLLSEINLATKIPGNAQNYGISNPGIVTGRFMADIMFDLETGKRQGELDNLVDLTNNSDLYKEKGGEYENISWNPANPSPETTTDITKSKQYQLIGDIEEAFSLRLGTNIKFDEDQKKKLAMEIRKISSGKRRSVKSDTSKRDRDDLTNKRIRETAKSLIGE